MLYVLPCKQWTDYLELSLEHFFGNNPQPTFVNPTPTNIREMVVAIIQTQVSDLMFWKEYERRNPILHKTEFSTNLAQDRYNRACSRLFPFYLDYLIESEYSHNNYGRMYGDICQYVLDPLEVLISAQVQGFIGDGSWDIWTIATHGNQMGIQRGIDYRVQHFEQNQRR